MMNMGWHQPHIRSSPSIGVSSRLEARASQQRHSPLGATLHEARTRGSAAPLSPLSQQRTALLRARGVPARSPAPESLQLRASKSLKDVKSGVTASASNSFASTDHAVSSVATGHPPDAGNNSEANAQQRMVNSQAPTSPSASCRFDETLVPQAQLESQMVGSFSQPATSSSSSATQHQRGVPPLLAGSLSANVSRTVSPQASSLSPPAAVAVHVASACGELQSAEAPPGPQLHHDGSLRYPGRGALARRGAASKDLPGSSLERPLLETLHQRGASGEVPARRGRQETPQQRRQDFFKSSKIRQEGGKSEEPTWRASATHSNGGAGVVDAEQASVANTVREGRDEAVSLEAPPALSASNVDRKTRKDFRPRDPSAIVRQASVQVHYGKARDPRIAVGRAGLFSRHSSEKDLVEAAHREEILRNEIARLEARCEQLQTAQSLQQQAAVLPVEKDVRDASALSDEDSEQKCRRLEQVIVDLKSENQRSQEEMRRLAADVEKRAADIRSERERWREDREAFLVEKRRQDKAEETLRRQLADVQKRLDNTLGKETEREQERRQLKSQVQALEKEKSKAEFDTREAELQEKNLQLEMQVQNFREDNNRLLHQLHRLEGERTQAYARLVAERSDRAQPRGRGRTILPGGRGQGPSLGVSRRGLPAGRGSGSFSVSEGQVSSFGATSAPIVNSRVPISCLPSLHLDRLRPPEENESAIPRSPRSPSTSSTTSSSYVSSDGSSSVATASRRGSCARIGHMVFGDAPLQKIPDVGWYFQLRILTVCAGWVGGFGIGVTLSMPTVLATLPDRASRVDHSWLAGYWGRTFSNGNEQLSDWQPQNLEPNDEVGFLVTTEGECVVFVNGMERCRFGDPPVPVRSGDWTAEPELTALIDVAPGSISVEFLKGEPPPRSAVARRPSVVKQLVTASSTTEVGQVAPTTTPLVNATGEISPPPPPPSPTRNVSPQFRPVPAVGAQHSSNYGGTSSPPVPPHVSLRQGLSPQTSISPQATWCTSTSVVQTRVVADNRAARAVAARRVPQLPLPLK